MEYEGDGWLGYDRRFRQRAAANPDTVWARLGPTLWNIAFAGQAKSARCKRCFSLTHKADDCNWAPPVKSAMASFSQSPTSFPTRQANQLASPICYAWNHSPEPTCPFPSCKYMHICLYCGKDPQVSNRQVDHKAMHCRRHRRPSYNTQQRRPFNAARLEPPLPTTVQRFHPYQ